MEPDRIIGWVLCSIILVAIVWWAACMIHLHYYLRKRGLPWSITRTRGGWR